MIAESGLELRADGRQRRNPVFLQTLFDVKIRMLSANSELGSERSKG